MGFNDLTKAGGGALCEVGECERYIMMLGEIGVGVAGW